MCSDIQNRVGTPHINMCSHVQNRMGTPHIKMFSDVQIRVGTDILNGVGTPHIILRKSLAVGEGWVGRGGWSEADNNATAWLHLAS